MQYAVVLHKDSGSDYGVTVPDLPGCFSAGTTVDEALTAAVEAIETHIEGMMMDGEVLPSPNLLEHHQSNPNYAGGIWALVSVDVTKLSGKSKRVNITLPEKILSMVDQYASARGETRSGFIAQAALEYIASHERVAS
ncbi:MAG: type II toxin-antitoxin system HicB family antitoxin [Anaerolineales bacterium]